MSVIVAAHNELDNLRTLLATLQNQNYPQFEVIIVNDRSWDGTFEFLEEAKKQLKFLKVVAIDDTPGNTDPKKYALTLGIKAAQYEHLLFTDADCIPASYNWILQMQSGFGADKSIVLGISHYSRQNSLLNAIIRLETLYTCIQYICFALRGMPYMGVGRNLAYKKSLFMENKGFHPHMFVRGGDDDLFINKVATMANTAVCVNTQAYTLSKPKNTWKQWLQQKRRHLSVGKLYKTKHKFALSLLHFSHLFSYLLLPVLFLTTDYANVGAAMFLLRFFVFSTVFFTHAKNMRVKINLIQVLIFDFFYLFYILIVGVRAYNAKYITWK